MSASLHSGSQAKKNNHVSHSLLWLLLGASVWQFPYCEVGVPGPNPGGNQYRKGLEKSCDINLMGSQLILSV